MEGKRHVRLLQYRHVMLENVRHKVRARSQPVIPGSFMYFTLCGCLVWHLHAMCFDRLYHGQPFTLCVECERIAGGETPAWTQKRPA